MPLLSSLVDRAHENIGAEGSNDGDNEEPDAGAKLVHVGHLLLALLTLKEGRVGLELEDEVCNVGEEKNNRGAARESEQTVKSAIVGEARLFAEVAPERAGALNLRGVVCGSDEPSWYQIMITHLQAAGMIRVMQARVIRDELV